MTRPRTAAVLAAVMLAVVLTACSAEKSPFPGDSVDRDPEEVWTALMRLPDTDQARQQYQKLDAELRQALASAIPTLASWKPSEIAPACGPRAVRGFPASATTAKAKTWATTG